jgi:hypothetical protein
MTRKDYQLLANALHAAQPEHFIVEFEAWAECCKQITLALRQDNPRFDEDKFMEACIKGVK